MKAQIKEVPHTDGCQVELRLPTGHLMNRSKTEYVRRFWVYHCLDGAPRVF